VYEDYRPVQDAWWPTPEALSRRMTTLGCGRSKDRNLCFPVPGFLRKDVRQVERIALFHYLTRSREDYANKMSRGGNSAWFKRKAALFDATARCAHCKLYTGRIMLGVWPVRICYDGLLQCASVAQQLLPLLHRPACFMMGSADKLRSCVATQANAP
jgi:hypothetical protein